MQTVILHGKTQKRFAHDLIERAPAGAILTVKEANRSTDQNSMLWACLSDISRSKPDGRQHTPEVWKALFMNACGHAVQFETGLNGQPFPVGFQSSKLSKSQMADLLTFVLQYGDEKNVVWTNPKDPQADTNSGSPPPEADDAPSSSSAEPEVPSTASGSPIIECAKEMFSLATLDYPIAKDRDDALHQCLSEWEKIIPELEWQTDDIGIAARAVARGQRDLTAARDWLAKRLGVSVADIGGEANG